MDHYLSLLSISRALWRRVNLLKVPRSKHAGLVITMATRRVPRELPYICICIYIFVFFSNQDMLGLCYTLSLSLSLPPPLSLLVLSFVSHIHRHRHRHRHTDAQTDTQTSLHFGACLSYVTELVRLLLFQRVRYHLKAFFFFNRKI